MSIEILDPTHEGASPGFLLAARLSGLEGRTVGIVSNGKYGTKPFFDAFEQSLRNDFGVGDVVRRTKSNYSAPADAAIMEEARHWDALVAGIGD